MFREETAQSLRQVIIGGTMAFLILAGFVIFFLVMYLNRKRKHYIEKEKMRSAYQEELLRTQLEIQEQTLKTISEEIHDNIGQALSLAKLKLNTLKYDQPDLLVEKINDSRELISKAIRDLRDLSRSLNTDSIASMGLVRAIELELELFRKSGFQTTLYTEGEVRKMEPQQELILFRIVQESLNNIIKHADAKTIRVTALYTENELDLQVEDDGKGADASQLDMEGNSYKSLGLRNMSNRARMIGGTFSIHSVPGNGTIIKLNIPLNKN
jgi:two-component system, NarL family, sensor kinase